MNGKVTCQGHSFCRCFRFFCRALNDMCQLFNSRSVLIDHKTVAFILFQPSSHGFHNERSWRSPMVLPQGLSFLTTKSWCDNVPYVPVSEQKYLHNSIYAWDPLEDLTSICLFTFVFKRGYLGNNKTIVLHWHIAAFADLAMTDKFRSVDSENTFDWPKDLNVT